MHVETTDSGMVDQNYNTHVLMCCVSKNKDSKTIGLDILTLILEVIRKMFYLTSAMIK